MIREFSVDGAALAALAEPVCQAHGVELVEVRHVRERDGAVVRVTIDRPLDGGPEVGSGVSLEDCTGVSRELSEVLDAHEDLIAGEYRLEVSSPGLDRPLVKPRDFERFAGKPATVELREPIGNRKKFHGRIVGLEGDGVRLEQDGAAVVIPIEQIKKAHLKY